MATSGHRLLLAGAGAWLCVALAGAQAPTKDLRTGRDILERLWQGVEQATRRHSSGCGSLTETRTSPLFARPLVLRGTFCVAGTDRFRLDYTAPEILRIIYNDGYLNVTTDGGRQTAAFAIGGSVRRTQDYFSGPDARRHIESDFSIAVDEDTELITLRLEPKAGRLARRVTSLRIVFDRTTFLPRQLEFTGTSGVTSRFEIRIDQIDVPLDEEMFRLYRPKLSGGGRADAPADR